MGVALVYIISQAFYRIGDFFDHWYIGGARVIVHRTLLFLESCDRSLALRVTVEHFFDPLYQDHSVLGHLLGVIFRSGRILLAVFVYALVSAIALFAYVLWAGVLTYSLYLALTFFFS